MTSITGFFKSSLGLKAIMAVTGLILFGFVLVHMLGNLKLYQPTYPDGTEPINAYGEFLREVGKPVLPHGGALWIARFVLLGAVGAHIWAAWKVTRQSWAARSSKYRDGGYVQADYATRTMRWGGVIIALFVLYHLAHFTWGTVHHDFIPHDVHHNLIAGFSVWWVSAIYIVANLALGLHLYHGLWSLFRTLGVAPHGSSWQRQFAAVFAVVVVAGNISFPLAVLAGLVG